jgi:hypothetical protein
MSDTFSVWFPIGNGPLLKEARKLLDGLQIAKTLHGLGHYRIGDTRRRGSQKEIEIIFESEDDAVMGKMSAV